MHERLQEGDLLTIEAPKNDFPLHTGPGGTVLVAGGIGVTPLASMAAQRVAREGAPVRMHYAGRSRELMAFLPELQAAAGRRPARPRRCRSRRAARHRCAARRLPGRRPALRLRPQGRCSTPCWRAPRRAAGRTTACTSSSSPRRWSRRATMPFEVELAQSRPALHRAGRPEHPRLPDRARLRPDVRLQARRMRRVQRRR